METKPFLKNIRIVLVDTQDGANIGSCCRAMKTMGITRLAVTGERVYDDDRVRTLALHAQDIWDRVERFPSLPEALEGSIFTVGATRRHGKFRKMSVYSPFQLAEKAASLPEGTLSIVFGRESDGLRDDEIAQCSSIVTIPTSDAFPSLNLSQAVQIICYELFTGALVYKPALIPVTHERARNAARGMTDSLSAMGYFKLPDEEKWTNQLLGDIIERASLTEAETKRFEKIFRKAGLIAMHKRSGNA